MLLNSFELFLSQFTDPILRAMSKLPTVLLAFMIGYLVLRIGHWALARLLRLARVSKTLYDILLSVLEVALWVVLAAIILHALGLSQVALALSGSVAIVGLALAAGANLLVQDLIAGLFLSRDRDFQVGYRIKTEEVEGKVERIDARKVRVEDDKGLLHVISASAFDKASWTVIDRDTTKKVRTK